LNSFHHVEQVVNQRTRIHSIIPLQKKLAESALRTGFSTTPEDGWNEEAVLRCGGKG